LPPLALAVQPHVLAHGVRLPAALCNHPPPERLRNLLPQRIAAVAPPLLTPRSRVRV
jgi:hypothetical protein